jgi:hypothetical protein
MEDVMRQANPTRRIMLGHFAALGCGLCLSAVPARMAMAQAAPKKMSQAAARYQAQPKGDHSCGNCTNFIAQSKTCKLVDGSVSPEGWCNSWSKKP